jgi:hypothetical protein
MDKLARRKHILANRLSVALVIDQGAQTVSSQRQQTTMCLGHVSFNLNEPKWQALSTECEFDLSEVNVGIFVSITDSQ